MDFFLIDGNSYFYRAYHAIGELRSSKGFPTNAIYGFTNMILKVLREKKPDAFAIVFDSPAPTERHRMYAEYKAHRPEMPDELALQIPRIKEVIKAFNIPMFEIPGFEADDIIGAMAKRAAEQGASVFIVSSDKDMMQVVGSAVRIYDPVKDTIIDEGYIRERFGVSPERISEFMALTGDTADNIPGVKGIGEKRAKELLLKAGSLDELLQHPEKIENARFRCLIAENIDTINLSKALATIILDLPVEFNLDELAVREPDWQALLRLFTEFEFKSLLKMIPAKGYGARGHYETITDRKQLLEFLGKA
ncbi:MAG TPA: 5'-3' exonuclease H3TH domain-containing protein [Dissulfurispiraceae bacterium]